MPPRVPKPTCCVCFDKFNQTIRAPTTCPHCEIQICRTCFQTYLLNEVADVPRCVNTECDRGWERNFLDSEMTSTFRLKTYKEHREKVLADREKSKLPATQADAAEVAAGFASRQGKIRSRGYDPEEILKEQIEDKQRADAAGLAFTTSAAMPPSAPDPGNNGATNAQ